MNSDHILALSWFTAIYFLLLAREDRYMTSMYILRTDDRPKISNSHISATASSDSLHACLVLGQGFRGRRIESLYFRLDQIEDRGRQPSCIILNGHIAETVHHPFQFVFGSRVKVWDKIMREEQLQIGHNLKHFLLSMQVLIVLYDCRRTTVSLTKFSKNLYAKSVSLHDTQS